MISLTIVFRVKIHLPLFNVPLNIIIKLQSKVFYGNTEPGLSIEHFIFITMPFTKQKSLTPLIQISPPCATGFSHRAVTMSIWNPLVNTESPFLISLRNRNLKWSMKKAHMDFINKSIDEIEMELFLRSRQYDTQI